MIHSNIAIISFQNVIIGTAILMKVTDELFKRILGTVRTNVEAAGNLLVAS